MGASLKLEFPGHDVWCAHKIKGMRPWVAEIQGYRFNFERVFLDPNTDYSEADDVGARGVYLYHQLSNGRIYEVHDRALKVGPRRYFARCEGGELTRVTREEVLACVPELV